MTRDEFESLLRRYPALVFEVLKLLVHRLREADNAMIRELQQKNSELSSCQRRIGDRPRPPPPSGLARRIGCRADRFPSVQGIRSACIWNLLPIRGPSLAAPPASSSPSDPACSSLVSSPCSCPSCRLCHPSCVSSLSLRLRRSGTTETSPLILVTF